MELLLVLLLVGFPIWQSIYNYKRYKKIKVEFEKLRSIQAKENSAIDVAIILEENKKLKNDITQWEDRYNGLNRMFEALKSKERANSACISIEKDKSPTPSSIQIISPELTSHRVASIKYSIREIQQNKDKFIGWENNGTQLNLIIKTRDIGHVDYEPKCNYVNRGWRQPEIIQENSECCTVCIGDAYIQVSAPREGIVYYNAKENLSNGDTVISIESDIDRISEFEKQQIKDRILEKKRKRELEKLALQELIDEGEIFPEANKRPPIQRDVVDAVWNRDSGKCVYCNSTENLHLDHIIPFSKGGDTSVENLQLLCQKCNLEKSNKIG